MKILYESWSVDGIINVLIHNNGKSCRYEYVVDAAFIPNWVHRMSRTPGKVFSEIKRKAISFRKLN